MQGTSLGSVEYGKPFYFVVSNRAQDGSRLSFTPAYFDVLDPRDGSVLIANEPLVQITGRDLWRGTVDSGTLITDQTEAISPYISYAIVVKEDSSSNPLSANPDVFQLYNFTVTGAVAQRLERLLGLSGENTVIDNYEYDAGNNLTSARIRVFESSDAADDATLDIVAMEPGELYRYTMTQTFSAGLQLRQSHKSIIDTDQGEG